jgi:sugar/nucleoside kinase (ribokinase family)
MTDGSKTKLRLYTPNPEADILNVTGAGDSLVGAFIAGLEMARHSPGTGYFSPEIAKRKFKSIFQDDEFADQIMLKARYAAELSLASNHAVSPQLGEW